ncbi:MAG: c-type cytochrome [Acidobacteriota bacterium]|nr:c-type cytochrome [Acidobacteriota bacterium]
MMQKIKRWLLPLFLLAVAALPREAWPQTAKTGAQLYQTHCAACHGQTGEGNSGPTLATPRLVRATNEAALLKIIKEGIAGTEMPSSRLDDAQIKQLAAFVQDLGKLPVEKPSGDAIRGAKLYAGKGGCADCHAINGEGNSYGPDLSDIGLRRGAKHLLTSLIDPTADVPKSYLQFRPGTAVTDNFLQVRIVTRTGQRINGVRVNEDSFTIHVREMSGQIHSFFKSELRQLHKDWGKSSMPSYRKLTQTDLDDLVAYLLTLRGER